MLYDSVELEEIATLLKVVVAIQSFQVGKLIFDMIYRMILKHAN